MDGGNYASTYAAQAMFEKQLAIKKVGLEFTLAVMLDPFVEEGKRALQEYVELPACCRLLSGETN